MPLQAGETKYTHSLGLLPLREAIVGYYNKKFGLQLGADQVIVTSGTSPAMLLLFMAMLEPGDEVIMSNPYYACHPNFVKIMDGKPVFVYTNEADGFNLSPESVAAAITPKTKAILINSPANPTGQGNGLRVHYAASVKLPETSLSFPTRYTRALSTRGRTIPFLSIRIMPSC